MSATAPAGWGTGMVVGVAATGPVTSTPVEVSGNPCANCSELFASASGTGGLARGATSWGGCLSDRTVCVTGALAAIVAATIGTTPGCCASRLLTCSRYFRPHGQPKTADTWWSCRGVGTAAASAWRFLYSFARHLAFGQNLESLRRLSIGSPHETHFRMKLRISRNTANRSETVSAVRLAQRADRAKWLVLVIFFADCARKFPRIPKS